MKFYQIAFLFFTGISSLVFSQNQDRIVAEIGDKVIYESEFIERYELTPSFNKQVKGRETALKFNFIYTLIAEKLWASEAEDLGIDQRPEVVTAINSIEKMYVRDALYRREILDKISISEEEIIEGTIRNANSLYLKFIFSKDEEAIFQLHELLNQGIPFDTVVSARPEKDEQVEPIEIVFGQMEKSIEDSVYKLNLHEYTSPLLTVDGWYIFSLADKKEQLFNTEKEKEDAIAAVKKIIRKRKEMELYSRFYEKFFAGKRVDTNAQLFEELYSLLLNTFKDKFEKASSPDERQLFHLDAYDVIDIEKKLGEKKLAQTFLTFPEKTVTLKSFFRDLVFEGIQSEKVPEKIFRLQFDERVKKYIEQELLSDEGYRRGIHLLPEVQNSMKMWRSNYLQQALQNQIIDSIEVSDSAVLKYYENRYTSEEIPMQVNIVEVLTDSLETVDHILSELEKGVPIKQLASKFTEREWTRENGGEFGFFPINAHPEIGMIAAQMEVGDIFGPLNLEEGYSIFQLIGKEERKVAPPSKTFEEVKESLRRELAEKEAWEKIINKTFEFAEKYKFKIDADVLKSIEVTSINSFAIRNMGFGGKVTAVPLTAPFVEWIYKLRERTEELP
ncbi:MAG: peptidylprolyl isomerase [Melioribacteraceae bacterium]|nr:peptidylprolyl isomerase [Melioribacteraceae bacterium]